jgi:hypothetical protein
MDLQEEGWEHGLDSFDSGQGQVAVTNLQVTKKCGEFLD